MHFSQALFCLSTANYTNNYIKSLWDNNFCCGGGTRTHEAFAEAYETSRLTSYRHPAISIGWSLEVLPKPLSFSYFGSFWHLVPKLQAILQNVIKKNNVLPSLKPLAYTLGNRAQALSKFFHLICLSKFPGILSVGFLCFRLSLLLV